MTTPHADLYEYEVEKPDRIPNTWVSVQRSPLIVYLHGIGESGGDGSDQVRTHGPWKNEQFNLNVKGHLGQYFVVAPHLENRGDHWNAQRLTATLGATFDEIRQEYGDDIIDSKRVYVTGNSRGGRGALELVLRGFPEPQNELGDPSQSEGLPFRAAAIICPEQGARGGASERLRDQTRYQFFHRKDDTNGSTRGTYSKFMDAPNAKFHIYPGCSHNCWTTTYANSALYNWFDDPDSQPNWGTACDRGMCAQDAKELIEVKKLILAPFCGQHAQQYSRGQEKWVADYKARLERMS